MLEILIRDFLPINDLLNFIKVNKKTQKYCKQRLYKLYLKKNKCTYWDKLIKNNVDYNFAGFQTVRGVTYYNLFISVSGNKRENVELPAGFWWAQGQDALNQNWATGDFSTWINQQALWEAFGVTFALAGVLELLPVERRAAAARSLSVVGMPGWLSAKEARQFGYGRAGLNPASAGRAIMDGCLLGYVTARAVLMRRADGGESKGWSAEEREWDIPEWYWDNFTQPNSSAQDWERGVFSGRGRGPHGYCAMTLTGVYFVAETLNLLLGNDARQAESVAPALNPGGRPRKEWWDDLWCAIWGDVYRGKLDPKRQADIEQAMLTWAESNGHSISESMIRPVARKMLAEMTRKDENP